MVYYGGNKHCLGCLNAAVYFVFWASCSSPHKFSFEFAFVAFNALCFHFEDNGGQGKLTSPNLNFLSFTSYLFFFLLTSVGLFFFSLSLVFPVAKMTKPRSRFLWLPRTCMCTQTQAHTISSHLDLSLTLCQSLDRKHLSRWDPVC